MKLREENYENHHLRNTHKKSEVYVRGGIVLRKLL